MNKANGKIYRASVFSVLVVTAAFGSESARILIFPFWKQKTFLSCYRKREQKDFV